MRKQVLQKGVDCYQIYLSNEDIDQMETLQIGQVEDERSKQYEASR